MEQKFYVCSHCGNIIAYVKDAGVPVMCCGQKMQELIPVRWRLPAKSISLFTPWRTMWSM